LPSAPLLDPPQPLHPCRPPLNLSTPAQASNILIDSNGTVKLAGPELALSPAPARPLNLSTPAQASNILIDSNGTVKLADFGLARTWQERQDSRLTNRVITLWYR